MRGPAQTRLFELAAEVDVTVRLTWTEWATEGIIYTVVLRADDPNCGPLRYEAQGLRENACLAALERLTIWSGERWCDECYGTGMVEGPWADVQASCGDCYGGMDTDPFTPSERYHTDIAQYLALKS